MSSFEYRVTKHPADAFHRVAYFCSEGGECGLEEVPADHVEQLLGILNKEGAQGWELVQLFFSRDGVVAVWKRAL
jgi:hypothetical protein